MNGGAQPGRLVDQNGFTVATRGRGFSEQQATGVTEAIQEIDLSHLVTKQDLKEAIAGLEIRMLKWAVPLLLGQTAIFAAIVKWL